VLSLKVRESLKKNWGEKADALDCYAEVKFTDPLSSWCCYVFAMDQNEELLRCLLYSDPMGVEIYTLCMLDIQSMYNEEGEHPVIDQEYRRTRVAELIRRLSNDT
jgi:hypothetical protein